MILRAIENLDLPSQANQYNFDLLIDRISNGQCAVFVGSGLSVDVGYPSLQKLLREMATEAGLDLLQEKNISDDWMDDFQVIKETLGIERYRACLGEHFDDSTKNQQFNSILINLFNIPFCAYITTNYDPCLEFASQQTPSSPIRTNFTYPNLPVIELTHKHIFHIHGYVNPYNQDSVGSIVLSRDEYDDAYNNSRFVSDFLHVLFNEIDVVFIGFGWNDLVILDTISRAKETREVREDFATQRNFRLTRARNIFAIIDLETYERDRDHSNYLGTNGVRPIVYEKIAGNHNKLIYLVHEIQEKTSDIPITPMPSPPEGLIDIGENNE